MFGDTPKLPDNSTNNQTLDMVAPNSYGFGQPPQSSIPQAPDYAGQAIKLLSTVPAWKIAIGDAVADHANNQLTTNDLMVSAKQGTTPVQRATQIVQANDEAEKAKTATAIAQQQLDEANARRAAAYQAFSDHIQNHPNIPPMIKAELSDPEKLMAGLIGLFGGGLDTSAMAIHSAQQGKQHAADIQNAQNQNLYNQQFKAYQEQGDILNNQLNQAHYDVSSATTGLDNARTNERIAAHEKQVQADKAQAAKTKVYEDDLNQLQKNFNDAYAKSGEWTQEDEQHANEMIQALAAKHGVPPEQIAGLVGRPRVGQKTVAKQNANTRSKLADSTENRVKLGNAIKFWAGKIATIKATGIVTEDQRAALTQDRDAIAENFGIPSYYLQVPEVGKTWQRIAAENASQARNDALKLAKDRFEYEKQKDTEANNIKAFNSSFDTWTKDHKRYQDASTRDKALYDKAVEAENKARDEWMNETDATKKAAKEQTYKARHADTVQAKQVWDITQNAEDEHAKTAPSISVPDIQLGSGGPSADVEDSNSITKDTSRALGGSRGLPKARPANTNKSNPMPSVKDTKLPPPPTEKPKPKNQIKVGGKAFQYTPKK